MRIYDVLCSYFKVYFDIFYIEKVHDIVTYRTRNKPE